MKGEIKNPCKLFYKLETVISLDLLRGLTSRYDCLHFVLLLLLVLGLLCLLMYLPDCGDCSVIEIIYSMEVMGNLVTFISDHFYIIYPVMILAKQKISSDSLSSRG